MRTKQLIAFSDSQLVESFQQGNSHAFSELINRYNQKIYHFILFMVKETHLAEDILQETIIKVIESLRSHRYKEDGKILSWIIHIARNQCLDYFRMLKRRKRWIIQDVDISDFPIMQAFADNSPNIENIICEKESTQFLNQLINKLPEKQREVVVLRHFADMSFKQIAQITNCNINTALGRMRYAILNIRKMLQEKNSPK